MLAEHRPKGVEIIVAGECPTSTARTYKIKKDKEGKVRINLVRRRNLTYGDHTTLVALSRPLSELAIPLKVSR